MPRRRATGNPLPALFTLADIRRDCQSGPMKPREAWNYGAGFLVGSCVLLQSAAAGAQPPRGCTSVSSSASAPRQRGEERKLGAILEAVAEAARTPSRCNPAYTFGIDLRKRSIEIVRLATRGDLKALDRFISPTAEFVVWHVHTGAGRQKGAQGAVEFARRLGTTDFLYVESYSRVEQSECGDGDATLQLYGADPERFLSKNQAFVATFKYRNGCLTGATADEGALVTGKIGRD